ncbi:MAG TPA: hypothetical protein VEC39_08250 [Vicinamibacterales bacterium]|nr:hypothetical protein [Vicinamibacterales bacterium]
MPNAARRQIVGHHVTRELEGEHGGGGVKDIVDGQPANPPVGLNDREVIRLHP